MTTLTNVSDQGIVVNYQTNWTELNPENFRPIHLEPGQSVTISDGLATYLGQSALQGLELS